LVANYKLIIKLNYFISIKLSL